MIATRCLLLFALLVAAQASPARAAETGAASSTAERLERQERVKRLQIRKLQAKARRVLFGGPRSRPAEGWRVARRRVDAELSLLRGGNLDFAAPEVLNPTLRPLRPEGRPGVLPLGGGIAPNVPVSDPTGEELGSSQNEPSLAAWGSYVLAAYNDWPSLDSLGSIQGFSYSVNGGQTFVDGGAIPAPGGYIWTSDPVISVNERNGDFFYCGLVEDTLEDLVPRNGVGVVRGNFAGTSFQWDTPRIVRVVPNSEHFLDKPWIAADSVSGHLYLSYSDFFPEGTEVSNTIQFARSRDRGVTWDPELTLNSAASRGLVQGSRPAVGPAGEVYVTWKEIGPIDPGSDFMRIRKSTTLGASFGSEHTVAAFFDNYGTGAPGFNREKSVALPSIAVDRSRGANRGRVYVSWNESLNWYDDVPGVAAAVTESENNDWFLDPDHFTIGQTLLGTFRDDNDFDSWAFQAQQDSSYVFWADTVSGSTYRLRVWCADSLTRLTYTGHLETLSGTNESVMMFTAPSTGLYYLDMTNARIEGRGPGAYRILTGRARRGGERGRDQRDAFVATSADGVTWTTPPVMVNDDPPRFDDWLPEVATASNGNAYLIWYDWRDAGATQCGGLSSVYAATSTNGGASWSTLGSLTAALSNWTYVGSNLIPNQGDYLGLYANENAVYCAWTDGRLGTPDIYAAMISLLPQELQVHGIGDVRGEIVTIDWQFVLPRVVEAVVYRRAGTTRVALGAVTSDAAGHIRFTDSTVVRGTQYIYSLGVMTDEGERIVGDVVVSIAGIALGIAPNPMRSLAVVSFEVPPPGGQVDIMIHDVAGRRVRHLLTGFRAAGFHQVGWNARDVYGRVVKPGLYLVRVTVRGRTTARRVSVMP